MPRASEDTTKQKQGRSSGGSTDSKPKRRFQRQAGDPTGIAQSYFSAVAARDLDGMVDCWAPGGVENIVAVGELSVPGRDAPVLHRAVRCPARLELRGARHGRAGQQGGRALAQHGHLLRRPVPGNRAHGRTRRPGGARPAHDRGRPDPAQRRLLRRHSVCPPDRPHAAAGQRRRAWHDEGLQPTHPRRPLAFAVAARARRGWRLAHPRGLPHEDDERLPDRGRGRHHRLRRRHQGDDEEHRDGGRRPRRHQARRARARSPRPPRRRAGPRRSRPLPSRRDGRRAGRRRRALLRLLEAGARLTRAL